MNLWSVKKKGRCWKVKYGNNVICQCSNQAYAQAIADEHNAITILDYFGWTVTYMASGNYRVINDGKANRFNLELCTYSSSDPVVAILGAFEHIKKKYKISDDLTELKPCGKTPKKLQLVIA